MASGPGWLLFLWFWHSLVWANPVATDHVTARLIAERGSVSPGETLGLALVFDIIPGWHTYWRNPGDSGEPPRIDWRLPDAVEAGPIRWPYPELIRVGPFANFGYSGRAVHLIDLMVPAGWPVGQPLALSAEVHWLVCEEQCIPEAATLDLSLPVTGTPAPGVHPWTRLFLDARERLPGADIPGTVLESAGRMLRLRVPIGALPGSPTSARFFPDHWGLVQHAADQPWHLDGSSLVIDLAAGEIAEQAQPSGVLVVGTGEGTSAHRVSAQRVQAPRLQDGRPVGQETPAPMSLFLALGFALLGGVLLNLMPCVFPVLAMKALSLAGQGGTSSYERIVQGLAYTLGVLLFFAAVAALLLGLRAAGANLGWGFQLQYPPFVALMAYLFLVLGLSFAGAVTIGAGLMGVAAAGPTAGAAGAFVTGGLAALVAAPCTAPFMGAALGYAVTLAWPAAFAVILTLGLGLALPFLVIALLPGVSRRLPRPGAWMQVLKQFLAFPMFATAAWLLWVLTVQTGPSGVAAALAGMVLLTFGLWAVEQARTTAGVWRSAARAVAVAGVCGALYLGLHTRDYTAEATGSGAAHRGQTGLQALAYTPRRLSEAREEHRAVFVNMTAAWCITCLVNERVALSTAGVKALFDQHQVLYLKGDWTSRDPAITDYLSGFGRNGVPLYVYYPPGGEPRILPQILTESAVREALE